MVYHHSGIKMKRTHKYQNKEPSYKNLYNLMTPSHYEYRSVNPGYASHDNRMVNCIFQNTFQQKNKKSGEAIDDFFEDRLDLIQCSSYVKPV